MSSGGKRPPIRATRRHKTVASPAASPSSGSRNVVLRSFLTLGDIIEFISVEDVRTKDDAYIQPVRDEIHGFGPHKGTMAHTLGLIHIASRRKNEMTNEVLKRHTNPKKVTNQFGNVGSTCDDFCP